MCNSILFSVLLSAHAWMRTEVSNEAHRALTEADTIYKLSGRCSFLTESSLHFLKNPVLISWKRKSIQLSVIVGPTVSYITIFFPVYHLSN